MLPTLITQLPDLNKLQTRWAPELNALLRLPLVQGQLLARVALVSGANTINHGLGRALVGWIVVRQRASATIYDTQDTNQRSTLTLTLQASAPVVVDLWVF